MKLILPVLISLSGFLFVLLSAKLLVQRSSSSKDKRNRNRAIDSYVKLLPQNNRRQLISMTNINDAAFYYGEKLVKDKYANQLKNL